MVVVMIMVMVMMTMLLLMILRKAAGEKGRWMQAGDLRLTLLGVLLLAE